MSIKKQIQEMRLKATAHGLEEPSKAWSDERWRHYFESLTDHLSVHGGELDLRDVPTNRDLREHFSTMSELLEATARTSLLPPALAAHFWEKR